MKYPYVTMNCKHCNLRQRRIYIMQKEIAQLKNFIRYLSSEHLSDKSKEELHKKITKLIL